MLSKKEAGFRQMDRLGLNHYNVYIARMMVSSAQNTAPEMCRCAICTGTVMIWYT